MNFMREFFKIRLYSSAYDMNSMILQELAQLFFPYASVEKKFMRMLQDIHANFFLMLDTYIPVIKLIDCVYACNWINFCANFIPDIKDKITLLKGIITRGPWVTSLT